MPWADAPCPHFGHTGSRCVSARISPAWDFAPATRGRVEVKTGH